MSDIVSVRLSGKPICRFPAPTDTTPAILITLGADGTDYEVTTNIGAGLPAAALTAATGYALHTLAHALLAGDAVDLTDLDAPLDLAGGEN